MLSLRDVGMHLGLLRLLVVKDLKIKYKASAIGLAWSLLNPLLLMLVYTLIFGAIFKQKQPAFPIYILSGLLAWNFFSTSLNGATLAVVANGGLVKKVRFPASLLPLSMVLSGFVNYLISLSLLALLMLGYRHPVGLSLLLLPVLLLSELAFVSGLGLLLSALNVFFRDVEHFLGILLTVWFFATPVIYPPPSVVGMHGAAALLININPMTWLIGGYHDVFYYAPAWPSWPQLGAFIALSLVLLVGGFVVFTAMSRRFVEEA